LRDSNGRQKYKQATKTPRPENSQLQGRERVSASGIEKRKPQKVESINTTERRLIYEKEFIFGGAPQC